MLWYRQSYNIKKNYVEKILKKKKKIKTEYREVAHSGQRQQLC
jgi:hypothetical protein